MNNGPIKKTGFRRIDEDHMLLLEIMRELSGKVSNNNRLEEVTKTLQFYAADHFDREYRLMVYGGLSTENIQKHLLAHARFSDRVAQFAEVSCQNTSNSMDELTRMLRSVSDEFGALRVGHLKPDQQMGAYLLQWLLTHTNSMDQTMIAEIKQMRPNLDSNTFE
ncbi:MAG: hemerythrin family protein [Magnetococcales bacterium]|nr:hemerythrin family protein [Magnetococcales bacterium]